MKLVLSCYKCGSSNFENDPKKWTAIQGNYYLLQEEADKSKVICKNCGLKDCISNLVIKGE